MKLKLIRDTHTDKSVTGRLYCEDEFICYTLENAWKDNERRVSCIPEGVYPLTSKEYGRYWEKYKPLSIPILEDVPNRSQILIHPGNFPKDTLGCILVGNKRDKDYVGSSRKTWKKYHHIFMECNEIEIKNETDS